MYEIQKLNKLQKMTDTHIPTLKYRLVGGWVLKWIRPHSSRFPSRFTHTRTSS